MYTLELANFNASETPGYILQAKNHQLIMGNLTHHMLKELQILLYNKLREYNKLIPSQEIL
jgi:hypothetical protein